MSRSVRARSCGHPRWWPVRPGRADPGRVLDLRRCPRCARPTLCRPSATSRSPTTRPPATSTPIANPPRRRRAPRPPGSCLLRREAGRAAALLPGARADLADQIAAAQRSAAIAGALLTTVDRERRRARPTTRRRSGARARPATGSSPTSRRPSAASRRSGEDRRADQRPARDRSVHRGSGRHGDRLDPQEAQGGWRQAGHRATPGAVGAHPGSVRPTRAHAVSRLSGRQPSLRLRVGNQRLGAGRVVLPRVAI